MSTYWTTILNEMMEHMGIFPFFYNYMWSFMIFSVVISLVGGLAAIYIATTMRRGYSRNSSIAAIITGAALLFPANLLAAGLIIGGGLISHSATES